MAAAGQLRGGSRSIGAGMGGSRSRGAPVGGLRPGLAGLVAVVGRQRRLTQDLKTNKVECISNQCFGSRSFGPDPDPKH